MNTPSASKYHPLISSWEIYKQEKRKRLANSLSPTGGYVPMSSQANYSPNTPIPQVATGKSYLEQTTVSPEIVGAALSAGGGAGDTVLFRYI